MLKDLGDIHDKLSFFIVAGKEVDEYFNEKPHIDEELNLPKDSCGVDPERDHEGDVKTDKQEQYKRDRINCSPKVRFGHDKVFVVSITVNAVNLLLILIFFVFFILVLNCINIKLTLKSFYCDPVIHSVLRVKFLLA